MITTDGYTVPSACFNPNLMQSLNGLCDSPNNYVLQVPFSYTASFIDLRGNYLKADLDQDNFVNLITSALQRTGISSTGNSNIYESRTLLKYSIKSYFEYSFININ